ncbi:hypothetical protein [Acidihalobacter prosperus]|uniref:Uncharacterized protein n=1 Tax=Acidihalobacter prosperus TaxID=160660 RepID=A0A1A6C0D3_9GAMM|nr:hypothetical protein [Acidihalobacter prosperus]OBS08014.1 hypothetical protein Thpro_022264 [Acidihalobacter prosperus]
MPNDRAEDRHPGQPSATPKALVAPHSDQLMAERLLLETLPRPQPAPEAGRRERPPGEWPEPLQREMDLAIVTTFFSAGVIGLFLWMAGLF